MAVIFVISNQQDLPAPDNGIADLLIKKTGHVLEYAILGLLLSRACHATMNGRQLTPALAAIIIGGLYALSDEIHQVFVPTRSGTVHDILLDLAAVAAAVTLAWLWRRRSATADRPGSHRISPPAQRPRDPA